MLPIAAQLYDLESKLAVVAGRDRWLFVTRKMTEGASGEAAIGPFHTLTVTKNGRVVRTSMDKRAWLPPGDRWHVSRLPAKGPFPLIQIQGDFGPNTRWSYAQYRIHAGRLEPLRSNRMANHPHLASKQ